MITGMNATTGRQISCKEHLQQSIADILITPIGSRVMRRTYGSYLFELIDQAANAAGILRLMAATADALMRWEPRLKLNKVTIDTNFNGDTTIQINGLYQDIETYFEFQL